MPIAVALSIAGLAHAEKLVINSNQSDPAPKQAFAKVVDEFKKQNPDLFCDGSIRSRRACLKNKVKSRV